MRMGEFPEYQDEVFTFNIFLVFLCLLQYKQLSTRKSLECVHSCQISKHCVLLLYQWKKWDLLYSVRMHVKRRKCKWSLCFIFWSLLCLREVLWSWVTQ